jgi:PAS domain S-box-containing protein
VGTLSSEIINIVVNKERDDTMIQWFRKQPLSSGTGNNGGDVHIALTRKLVDYLSSQLSSPKKATSILSQIGRFKELPPTYQEKELPALYLKIEHYLVNEDPMQKFTKSLLRKTVKYRYEPLMEMVHFSLIFEDEPVQEILLSQAFLKNLILKSNTIIGTADEKFLSNISDWVDHIPNVDNRPTPFDLKEKLPQNPGDWIPLLAKVSQKIYNYLEHLSGVEEAASIFEKCYREIAEYYRPLETFFVVVQLLPNNLLDENKIGLLNGEQIRNVFLNKVGHLQKTNEELFSKNVELKETQAKLLVAQDTALESVKLLHSVLDTVEEGIVTADSGGKIILVNEQIQTMFGHKEDELIGQNIQTLMPEKYREQHLKGMKRYLKTRESRAIGERLLLEGLKKDETTFPIELQIIETQINDRFFFTAAMRDISADIKSESELKKTYHDLRLSEQRYRSLMETMPDVVFTLSLDGIFTTLNSAFERITGWPKDDWLGKPFTQVVHPDDSMPALKVFQNVLQGHPSSLHEMRIRVKSGEYMSGEFSLTPQIENGKMIGALGIARDISKHKRNEEALHISEDRYEKLLEMSSDGIGIFVDGKLTFINNPGLKIFRATEKEQLLSKTLREFIHPHYQTAIKEWLEKISEGNAEASPRKVNLVGFDGEEVEAEVSAAAVVYQKKPAVQFAFRGIVPEKSLGDTVVQSQVQYQQVLESSPDAILIIDLDNVILDVNSPACRMYGGEHESLIGKDFLKLVPVNLRDANGQNIYLLMHDKADYRDSAHLTVDGSQFPVRMWAKRIEYADKPAILLTVRDISERKEMEIENEVMNNELHDAQHQAEVLQAALQEAQQKISDLQRSLKDNQTGSEDTRMALQELKTKFQVAQAKFQNAQMKIKKLGKMIPVCSSCKKIRDDDGFWRELDDFISNPANLELLQGVCPDCETPVTVTTENANSRLE